MVTPIQRVNVDFTGQMLDELDSAAADLNVSRQAIIKTLLRQALDQRLLAMAAIKSGQIGRTKKRAKSLVHSRRG